MNPHGKASSGIGPRNTTTIPHWVITDDLIWSNVLFSGRYLPGLYEARRVHASEHVWVIFAEAFWCSLGLNYSCSAAHVYDPRRRCRVVVRDTGEPRVGTDDMKTQVVLVNHLMAWHPISFSSNMQIRLRRHAGVETVQEWPFQPQIQHQQKWSYINKSKNGSTLFLGFRPCMCFTTSRENHQKKGRFRFMANSNAGSYVSIKPGWNTSPGWKEIGIQHRALRISCLAAIFPLFLCRLWLR